MDSYVTKPPDPIQSSIVDIVKLRPNRVFALMSCQENSHACVCHRLILPRGAGGFLYLFFQSTPKSNLATPPSPLLLSIFLSFSTNPPGLPCLYLSVSSLSKADCSESPPDSALAGDCASQRSSSVSLLHQSACFYSISTPTILDLYFFHSLSSEFGFIASRPLDRKIIHRSLPLSTFSERKFFESYDLSHFHR